MDRRPILLVEDNPDDVSLALRAFRKVGIQNPVAVAKDGEEAIQWLFGDGSPAGTLEGHDGPSIVLLDLKLPKIDGLEVLQRIRADVRTRLHRVVVLTSSREEADLLRCYDLGANSYIRKPVDFDKFLEAIGQIALYWLTLNEVPPVVRS